MYLTITADGTSTVKTKPGEYAIHVGGSFGGGTLSIQWSDGVNSVAFPDGSLTAAGGIVVSVGVPYVDFVLTGATSPDLDITINQISRP